MKNFVFVCFFISAFAVYFCELTASSTTIFPSQLVQSAGDTSSYPVITTNDDGTTTTNYALPGPALQNMKKYIPASYPATTVTVDSSGNYTQNQVLIDRSSSSALPSGYKAGLQGGSVGFFKITGDAIAPTGSALFSSAQSITAQSLDDSDSSTTLSTIAAQFDALVTTLSNNTNFVQFFRKIHLNILNELYEYLLNIYTNFNLTHPGSTSTSGSLTISIPDYLADQETYATNIKTLIVNHLINLIEEQFSSAVQAIMPNVPQLLATKVGKTTILSDFSVDLTHCIVQDISSDLADLRSSYLNALQQYLNFFQSYTSLISVADDSTGFSQFCTVAQNIDNQLSTTDMDTMLTKMNPAMFFYDTETMRALRVIPDLAKKLPSNTSSIGWPTAMVTAAESRSMVTAAGSTHPIAYFTKADGSVTTSQAQASHLYAVIQTGSNYFQEELLKQPDWLNSETGVLNILRACLGDFTALLGMNILDCCMETLITNGLNPSSTSSSDIATTCQSLIDSWSDTETVSSTTNNTSGTDTVPALPGSTTLPGLTTLPGSTALPTTL